MLPRLPCFHAAAAVLCLGAAVSCSTVGYQRQQDRRVFERVRAAYQQAKNNPGDARTAIAYADTVGEAWRSGAFSRCLRRIDRAKSNDSDDGEVDAETGCEISPNKHLEEAGRLLEKAAEVQKGDAPTLIAKKGLVYCSAKKTDVCLSELRRSMSVQPNVLAGTGLATWHGNHDNYRKVRRICKQTLPHLKGENTRYDFMKMCLNQSGAASARAGLGWASKESRQFFLQERKRRQRAARRQKRKKQRRKQRRKRRVKKCVANCKERGHLCMRDCRSEQCETSCNNAYQACLDKCEAEAQR